MFSCLGFRLRLRVSRWRVGCRGAWVSEEFGVVDGEFYAVEEEAFSVDEEGCGVGDVFGGEGRDVVAGVYADGDSLLGADEDGCFSSGEVVLEFVFDTGEQWSGGVFVDDFCSGVGVVEDVGNAVFLHDECRSDVVHLFASDLDVEDGGFFCDGAVCAFDVEAVVGLHGDGVAFDVVDDIASGVEGLDGRFETCEFFFDVNGGVGEEFAAGEWDCEECGEGDGGDGFFEVHGVVPFT